VHCAEYVMGMRGDYWMKTYEFVSSSCGKLVGKLGFRDEETSGVKFKYPVAM